MEPCHGASVHEIEVPLGALTEDDAIAEGITKFRAVLKDHAYGNPCSTTVAILYRVELT